MAETLVSRATTKVESLVRVFAGEPNTLKSALGIASPVRALTLATVVDLSNQSLAAQGRSWRVRSALILVSSNPARR